MLQSWDVVEGSHRLVKVKSEGDRKLGFGKDIGKPCYFYLLGIYFFS